MSGWSRPDITGVLAFDAPSDTLAQLRRDRDELLAALETSVAAWDDHRYGYEGIEQARALIRRIKGTP